MYWLLSSDSKSDGNHRFLRITCRPGIKTQPWANNQQMQMGKQEHRHRKATLVETNGKERRSLPCKHSPSSGTGKRGQLISGFPSLLSLSVIQSEFMHFPASHALARLVCSTPSPGSQMVLVLWDFHSLFHCIWNLSPGCWHNWRLFSYLTLSYRVLTVQPYFVIKFNQLFLIL